MLYIGVIGAGKCPGDIEELAEVIGSQIAVNGAVLVCGGRGGVMEAASLGAIKSGGTVLGILPGNDRAEANPFLTYSIVTGMGRRL